MPAIATGKKSEPAKVPVKREMPARREIVVKKEDIQKPVQKEMPANRSKVAVMPKIDVAKPKI